MIEYANEFVIKLLKQYEMFSKTLKYTTDLKQKNDICTEMTKIMQNIIDITNNIYEKKYKKISEHSVFLMDEEKNKLLELINLINERRVYVNNQISNNQEITGIHIETGYVLGEENLEDYKNEVKIIDKYKSNIKLESVLTEELQNLEDGIKRANTKIRNNQTINKQLEEKMIRILEKAFDTLGLYELKEREKEIDLAYTELGFSLEKAKENAKIARKECSEEVILECDNMLASITLEYERYEEKKLILKLLYLYKKEVSNYDELLQKREEMNNILSAITGSELYSIIGGELNKQYATIKLESQDLATLKSLTEEKYSKTTTLKEIEVENNSDKFKDILANLLENEKRYQQKLKEEERKKEKERLEKLRIEEKKKQEEIAKRQKAIEEERKKEIERRTKELLLEKENPILINSIDEPKLEKLDKKITVKNENETSISDKTNSDLPFKNTIEKRKEVLKPKKEIFATPTDYQDIFTKEINKNKERENNIPVIKNNSLEKNNHKEKSSQEENIFPDIPLAKKDDIFPDIPTIGENNNFFNDNEFKDLSNYMEDDKKSWF